ncbi:MAG: hypothetical protein M3Y72_17995 [Acidobacteriota bacterium]|nr:hypothetical protein [Acidobacteriota bacterium]
MSIVLPPKITALPPDAPFGAKQIVFHPGETAVDLYKHLDSGRLVHTQGTIEVRGNKAV